MIGLLAVVFCVAALGVSAVDVVTGRDGEGFFASHPGFGVAVIVAAVVVAGWVDIR